MNLQETCQTGCKISFKRMSMETIRESRKSRAFVHSGLLTVSPLTLTKVSVTFRSRKHTGRKSHHAHHMPDRL